MKTYTFFKIRSRAGVPDFEIEYLANPEAALAHARLLLACNSYKAIEIWDGTDAKQIAPDDSERVPVQA